MLLESFHKVLKTIYLDHKQNRRVDALLVTLIKVTRDKAFELFELEMGKSSHRICEINRRHNELQLLDASSITQVEETKWIIASQNSPGIIYTVQKLLNNCECQIRCKECTICPHYYSCTCLDSILHATVCKHIHLVHMNTTTTISQTLEGNQEPSDNYLFYQHTLATR